MGHMCGMSVCKSCTTKINHAETAVRVCNRCSEKSKSLEMNKLANETMQDNFFLKSLMKDANLGSDEIKDVLKEVQNEKKKSLKKKSLVFTPGRVGIRFKEDYVEKVYNDTQAYELGVGVGW